MAYAHRGSWMGGDNRGRIVDPWTDLTPGEETRRYQNVPSQQSYTTTVTPDTAQDLGYTQRLLQMVQAIDDRVQAAGRSVYDMTANQFGNSMNGIPKNVLGVMGQAVHGDRAGFEDNLLGQSQLYATRALQAGGLTAAGVGLANLTHAFQNQFGGPADESSPGTLYM